MIGLLRESWSEIANRASALLKCFWLAVFLECVVLALLFFGALAYLEAVAVLFVVLVLVVAPGAVRWHRHVIASEKVSWTPRLPGYVSLAYAAKLLAASVVYTIIRRFLDSVVNNLALPILGAALGSNAQSPPELITWFATEVLTLLAFVLTLGTWLLRLPEGALDPSARGVSRQWPAQGKSEYEHALIAVYSAPLLVVFSVSLLAQADRIWWNLMILASQIVSTVLGLSLLTVAYRRNLDHAGMTFGREVTPLK
jgi:hypothetical protein